MPHTKYLYLSLLSSLLFLTSCAGLSPRQNINSTAENSFAVTEKQPSQQFASAEIIKQLSASGGEQQNYQLGPGDIMDVSVWRRSEISRQNIVVAPDGVISLPKVGVINVSGQTITDITETITSILSKSYELPQVTVIVRQFNNNKAFVLGRVSEPGVVNFPGDGTLLEALALAGGLPHIGKDTFLTKCAIIRGNDTVIWIDLRDLLDNGNMSLNARIENNDVIFIPEAEDEMVMVLGEVAKAGPIMLKRGLNLVDAVMRAGGYTNAANLEKVFILRQEGTQGLVRQVDMELMLESGDFKQNFALQKDDIIYVSPTGITRFNYVMEQLVPSLKVLSMSTNILDNLGLTQKFLTVEKANE
jgi:polysaccharide export outer membrane protein